jgi:hypothetical protein
MPAGSSSPPRKRPPEVKLASQHPSGANPMPEFEPGTHFVTGTSTDKNSKLNSVFRGTSKKSVERCELFAENRESTKRLIFKSNEGRPSGSARAATNKDSWCPRPIPGRASEIRQPSIIFSKRPPSRLRSLQSPAAHGTACEGIHQTRWRANPWNLPASSCRSSQSPW